MKDFEFGCTNCGGPVTLVYTEPREEGGSFVCSLTAKCATPPCRQVMFITPEYRVASGSYHGRKMQEAEETLELEMER